MQKWIRILSRPRLRCLKVMDYEDLLRKENIQNVKVDFGALEEYQRRETEFKERSKDLEQTTNARDSAKKLCDDLRKRRLEEFMHGFNIISLRLKEMYQAYAFKVSMLIIDDYHGRKCGVGTCR